MHSFDSSQRANLKGFTSLEDLALNLRSSWNHSTDIIWQNLDSELWELTHNPWGVLQTVSKEKLRKLLADQKFSKLVEDLMKAREDEHKSSVWFQENYPKPSISCISYFSMEYMLSEALPIYSGGLGNVAGDQLKAASDLRGTGNWDWVII